jgi:ABC-2 type transport system ATP-binding protein
MAKIVPSNGWAVVVEDVSKRFAKHRGHRREVVAVDHLSFGVRRHEVFGILGPNGSGKSTLIRLIATLLWPDAGTIRVFGHDVRRETMAVRRLINRVSAEASFFKKLSARENLAYAAGLYGVESGVAARRAEEILAALGFPRGKFDSPLEDLSRGQQQKIAIARALLTSPTLLLLDEPTTGLDPRSRRDVQAYVEEVLREHDATVLLCTHDLEEAARLCHRVAFLERGRFVAVDTPEGFAERHGSLEAAFFALTGADLSEEVTVEG